MSVPEQKPWHASYPKPVSTAVFLPQETVLEWMESSEKVPGRDFVLVDLRRMDHEGGTIRDSINLPAQTMYHSIPALYNLLTAAGVQAIVFYCGSSQGRGSRAAAWMQDYIMGQGNDKLKSYALQGGIKGWVKTGGRMLGLMNGYTADIWEKEEKTKQ
ncbi:uncharacterized protein LAJ45_00744 [Morchella importuna]|uniref:uncharacterized protein n=1 Tax=Morchella importuna TaxID=1174673 RepID=UPI001E8CEFF8|nr:uncharacterized protein LAJ45_00744 [Morchella importuna]KAH8155734.1 hypothetical protein LAJ45_00744 [Morchella importuna]